MATMSAPLKHNQLNARLKHNDKTILQDLDFILLEIPNPETGQEYSAGFFQIPIGNSLEPDLYQLVLPDQTEAEILIMRSFGTGEDLAAFFSVVGDFQPSAA